MTVRLACFTLTAAAAISLAYAGEGDRRPLREAKSENGAWLLRIEPGRADRDRSHPCSATLLATGRERGAGNDERRRWERPLVNEIAPAAAAVREDGRFVVTLGEFRRGGARNALVVYGERGQLLRHWVLSDLLGHEDWQHVRTSKQSVEWLDGAKHSFEEPDRFVIDLKWGRQVVVDLRGLRILRGNEDGDAAGGTGEIPPDVLALLSGGDDDRDARLAALAEKIGTTPENLERLIEQGYVSAEKLDEVDLAAPDAEETGQDTRPSQPGEEAAVVTTRVEHQPAPNPGKDPAPTQDPPLPTPAEPTAGGIMIPPPDPANPVNYVDWLNAMAETAGPNAAPDIEAAIAAHKPWEGDQALFDAAMSGDATALADPAIQSWLDSNQEALAHIRAATTKEFAGWHLSSADGSMIGVLLPALAPQRALARAAVMDGKRLEATGDYDAAAKRYLDTLAAGAQAGQGPTLIENLVGVAVQGLAAEALLDLPARADPEQVDYVKLAREAEEAYQPVRPMDENVQFERAFMLDSIQRVFEPDATSGGYRVRPDKAQALFAMTGDTSESNTLERLAGLATLNYDDTMRQVTEYYDALAEATRLPYPEARGYMRELEQQLESTSNNNILIKTLTPALSRAHFIKTKAETQRRASLLVTNLMAYRQQHGALPDSLDALGERDFLTDPFTGQRFAYQRNGDDFQLYSWGGNGVDDGGVHDAKAESNDVVYWPRPAKP